MPPSARDPQISERASVAGTACVGRGSRIWAGVTIGAGAEVGEDCVVGERAFIDGGVRIGDRCKIQNGALVYAPAVLEDGVFIGPGAILSNDRHPRAVRPDGAAVGAADWLPEGVLVQYGASIGAGAVLIAGVEIGAWAMVGAAAVVTDHVGPHALVVGAPARQIGWVGRSGHRLEATAESTLRDPATGDEYRIRSGGLERVS